MNNKSKFIYLIVLCIMLVITSSNFVDALSIEGTVYDYNLESVENVIIEINTSPSQQYLAKDGSYKFEVPEGSYILKASKGNLSATEEVKVSSSGNVTFLFDIFLFPSMDEEDELWDDLESIYGDELTNGQNSSNNNRTWAYFATVGIILIAFGRIIIAKRKYKRKAKSKNTGVKSDHDSSHKPEHKTEKKQISEESRDLPDSKTEEKNKSSREEKLASIAKELEQNEQPGYLKRAIDIIKKNDGRITQKQLRKEMMDLSESKVSLILTELEHKGKIEKVKRGRGNVILLKE